MGLRHAYIVQTILMGRKAGLYDYSARKLDYALMGADLLYDGPFYDAAFSSFRTS